MRADEELYQMSVEANMTDREILEQLISGASADEIRTLLGKLTAEDRQAVLCTACFLVPEIGANCRRSSNIARDHAKAIPINRRR